VGIFIAAYLVHAARVALTGIAMLIAGGVIWLVLGIVTTAAGVQTGTVVLICMALVVLGAVAVGSFASVRYITPNSVLHPAIAAAGVTLGAVKLLVRGDVGILPILVPLCAGGLAALAALIFRSRGAPPNTSLERTRDE
jgi:hypothetical protein